MSPERSVTYVSGRALRIWRRGRDSIEGIFATPQKHWRKRQNACIYASFPHFLTSAAVCSRIPLDALFRRFLVSLVSPLGGHAFTVGSWRLRSTLPGCFAQHATPIFLRNRTAA